ncbi:MAG: deoxynucleoside kinase, partial [Myxococcaceae bacterium]
MGKLDLALRTKRTNAWMRAPFPGRFSALSRDFRTPYNARRMDHRYIVVEGPIGVGKSSLANILAERMQARRIMEVVEENPFLASFYDDRQKYAFQTQMFFLLSRY